MKIMDELDDLATYNCDTEHDMWVDFTTHEYTGELGDIFDEENVDTFQITVTIGTQYGRYLFLGSGRVYEVASAAS